LNSLLIVCQIRPVDYNLEVLVSPQSIEYTDWHDQTAKRPQIQRAQTGIHSPILLLQVAGAEPLQTNSADIWLSLNLFSSRGS